MTDRVPLSELRLGEHGRVVCVSHPGRLGKRLADMGLVPGVMAHVRWIAPLGDPIAVRVRGTLLSLRREEARHVLVEKVGHGPPHRGRHRG